VLRTGWNFHILRPQTYNCHDDVLIDIHSRSQTCHYVSEVEQSTKLK